MIERRSHPRVKASCTALCNRDVYLAPRVISTVDLSLGGIRVDPTPYRLFPDEELDISLLIHPRVIRCTGRVIHILQLPEGKQHAGIQFGNLSKRDEIYLREYISNFRPGPDPISHMS